MTQKIKDLFRKVYNKLFRKKSHRIIERKSDGTIHIFGDVVVHGNIAGGKSVNHHASHSEKVD